MSDYRFDIEWLTNYSKENLLKSALVRLRLKVIFLGSNSLWDHSIEMHALFQGQLFMSQLWLSQLSIHKNVNFCPFWMRKKKTFRSFRSFQKLPSPMNRLVKGHTHEMFSPYLYVELSPTFSHSLALLEYQDHISNTKLAFYLLVFDFSTKFSTRRFPAEFFENANLLSGWTLLCAWINCKFCYQFNRGF